MCLQQSINTFVLPEHSHIIAVSHEEREPQLTVITRDSVTLHFDWFNSVNKPRTRSAMGIKGF